MRSKWLIGRAFCTLHPMFLDRQLDTVPVWGESEPALSVDNLSSNVADRNIHSTDRILKLP